ncbi:hypothetical protein C8J57DRAFT_1522274 [Mycena rebaudengoi]|nr:hypothetical protein C8J57DRAFT_1522274 [Mycena rebaudengoi]
MSSTDGRPWIIQAIDAGVFTWISGFEIGEANTEKSPFESGDSSFITILKYLPSSFCYYSVLRRVEREIERSTSLPIVWNRRYQNPRSGHSGLIATFCDNLECDTTGLKTDFRRCSECMTRYYCSSACQKQDWEAGKHRTACRELQRKGGEELSSKDKAFLRYLLHHDYMQNKQKILALRAEFLMGTREPFYTTFDYSEGPLKIEVCSVAEKGRTLSVGDQTEWFHQASLASRSNGKIQFDVAIVPRGMCSHIWVFPLRSNSSRLHDGLLELVAKKRNGDISTAEFDEGLRFLAEEGGEHILEIH